MARRIAGPLRFCAPHALTPKLSRPQPGGANGGEGGLERCSLKGRRSGWGPTSNAGLGPARQYYLVGTARWDWRSVEAPEGEGRRLWQRAALPDLENKRHQDAHACNEGQESNVKPEHHRVIRLLIGSSLPVAFAFLRLPNGDPKRAQSH